MHYENGFDHMKIKLGFGVQDDINVMKSIQKVLNNENCTFFSDRKNIKYICVSR